MTPIRMPVPIWSRACQTSGAPTAASLLKVVVASTDLGVRAWTAFTPGSRASAASRDASVVTATPAYSACVA